MPVEITAPSHKKSVSLRTWQLFGEEVLGVLKLSKCTVSVKFVNNRTIQTYNRRFLNHNYATDVLSFPVTSQFNQKGAFLGDVLISVEMAEQQAHRFQTSFNEELALYLVHGILHLIGFEDHPKNKRIRMQKKEQQVLKQVKRRWRLKKHKALY